MKHLIPSKIASFIAILLIISIILAIPAYIIYKNFAELIIGEQGKNAMNISITVAELIEQDLDSYKKLSSVDTYLPGTYDEAYYKKMLKIFQHLKEQTGALYIYTEKIISDKEYVFILDAEDPGSKYFSSIGSRDTITEYELTSYYEKKPVSRGLIKFEKWGYFLTGFAPIIDPANNEVIGLVGTDVSATYVHSIINNIRNVIILSFLIIILFLGAVSYRIFGVTTESIQTDYQTGLYSKRYHERHLKRYLRKIKLTPGVFSLAMIDIDNFKEINDRFGHPFGDTVLKNVAEILKMHTRSVDVCSRYGGDEFMIILPGATKENASVVCKRILQAISSLGMYTESGESIYISASIGIAQWYRDMPLDALTSNADKALYLSKESGKNRVTIFDEGH